MLNAIFYKKIISQNKYKFYNKLFVKIQEFDLLKDDILGYYLLGSQITSKTSSDRKN